jgi:hypothetical protein
MWQGGTITTVPPFPRLIYEKYNPLIFRVQKYFLINLEF